MEKQKAIFTDKESILKLIPQRDPMVMVDTLIFSEGKSTRSALTIDAENLFVENGFFTEPGLIENIAQTAALRVGYYHSIRNEPTPPGYIGAIKHLEIHGLPAVGKRIETQVTVEQEIFGITLVIAQVWEDKKILAECEMKTVTGIEPRNSQN